MPFKRLARPPHCVTSFIDGPIWFEVQFHLQVFPVIIQLVINFVSTSCENFPGKNIHNHHPLQRNKKVFLIFSILLQFTYLGPRYFKIQVFKPDQLSVLLKCGRKSFSLRWCSLEDGNNKLFTPLLGFTISQSTLLSHDLGSPLSLFSFLCPSPFLKFCFFMLNIVSQKTLGASLIKNENLSWFKNAP